MSSDDTRHYHLQFTDGGIAPAWTKEVPFRDDAEAIEVSRRMLVTAASERIGPAAMLVGRGPQPVQWLGVWHWDNGAAWAPAD